MFVAARIITVLSRVYVNRKCALSRIDNNMKINETSQKQKPKKK